MMEKLPYDKFLESLKLAPRITIEIVMEDSAGGVLLVKRDKEPFVGFWHVPGGFLLKDEKIEDAIDRLAREEIDVSITDFQFLGYHETINEDPRNVHLIHMVFKCTPENPPVVDEKFGYFKVMPKNTISYHKDFLNKFGYKND